MSRRDARALAAAPFPIAVLHGRSDLLAPASRGAALARRLKASYIELEGAHFVTRERGPEVNALLRQIILHGPEYGADPHRYLAPRPAASVGAESAGSVGAACGGSGGDADADDVVSAPRIELVVVGREGSVGGGGGSPLRLPKAAAARPAPASAVVGQAASGRGAGAAAGNRAAKVAAATTQASASVAQAVASAATQAPGTPNGGASICVAFSLDQRSWAKAAEPIYNNGGHPGGLDKCHVSFASDVMRRAGARRACAPACARAAQPPLSRSSSRVGAQVLAHWRRQDRQALPVLHRRDGRQLRHARHPSPHFDAAVKRRRAQPRAAKSPCKR